MSAFKLVLYVLATIALCTAPSFAHFQLNYPPSRGRVDDLMSQKPCGGFNTVQAQRTSYPIQGGNIQLTSEHPVSKFAVNFAKASEPNNFVSIEGYQDLSTSGTFNITIGFDSTAGLSVGTEGVLQITYEGGDGTLYQCSDIVLSQRINGTIPDSPGSGFPSSSSPGALSAVAILAVAWAFSLTA